jgi:lipoic acid synthetase
MGNVCTRNCRFCAVDKGIPLPLDLEEPENIARAIKKLGLKHVVITSVTRDDLPDGGAEHFAKIVKAVRRSSPQTRIELLISDLQGSTEALKVITDSVPEVIGHNLETVPRLYSEVRLKADYRRSLNVLGVVKTLNSTIITKSGLMLGLGETYSEVIAVMNDLRDVNCDILTLGQYLCPSPQHRRISEYISPEQFDEYKKIAEQLGFRAVASSPFVRSSFDARSLFERV